MNSAMTVKPNVAILLATYNGSSYILQQLASLYSQQGVNFSLFVSDDGSDDDTLKIILDFA